MLIGYNYHPSRQGCAYWTIRDFSEIERDLAQMAKEGCDLVRFFLFWRDFEPEPGQYNQQAFELLHRFVQTAASYQLHCIPSLMTIWMNGQLFDLDWRNGRCLWSDPEMTERAERYLQKVAATLAACNNVFAYDIGDELPYVDLPSAVKLERSAAARWLERMVAAIKRGDPAARVIMANDHSALNGEHVFTAELIAGQCDLLAIHGFPLWAPFALSANSSYRASLYVPFLTKLAAAYSRPLIDEYGLYGASEAIRADYVRTSGTSALLHGAEGLVAWCWQDFVTRDKPYVWRPGEKDVGFYAADGTAKPSAAALQECRKTARLAAEGIPVPPAAAIYLPQWFRTGRLSASGAGKSYLEPLFHAFLLLTRLHVPMSFVTDQLDRYKAVIVPCLQQITQSDIDRLSAFVENGGTLIYTPGSYLYGFGGEELFGIRLRDFTRDISQQEQFSWRGRSYPIDWRQAGFDQIPIIQTGSAEMLSRYRHSLHPALTKYHLGKGNAYYVNAPIEMMLDDAESGGDEPYRYLYLELLKDAKALPSVFFTSPDVELHRFRTGDGERYFLINHTDRDVTGTLVTAGKEDQVVTIAKKGLICVNKRRV
ncbi:beta-galactosidase trimerization domain-containing protein [Brevibacillus humidisoli]|uniref:beta-galactosidase trimerization domain-containing protein n=1 Tax=Brevibacillus humidisoli TaxID=2895522 RepID=UPI001E447B69|nr:beta-galactosidase trimerization domain-containing protein [Brevibacillus humidisoli]UFJ42442.1 beta-galactosidase trimerization domain-containing protein [Brevibacillus humidisoli]